jgi:putative aldouronate transport system permease protein
VLVKGIFRISLRWGDFGVFYNLVLPTSKAVLAAIGLFYAVDMWNSFLTPYIYLQTPSKYPLQCVLRNLIIKGEGVSSSAIAKTRDVAVTEDGLKFAAIVVSVIPIIAVYPFIQKYFVKGVMLGSVKG